MCVQDEQTKARNYYKSRLLVQWTIKVQSALVNFRFSSCTLISKKQGYYYLLKICKVKSVPNLAATSRPRISGLLEFVLKLNVRDLRNSKNLS